jgi:hypothetical protein
VALGVAAGETAPAVVFVDDLDLDRAAGFPGAAVNRIGVIDRQVGGLGLGSADVARLHDQLAVFALVAHRAEHDHAAPQGQLGMRHRAVFTRDDHVLFEAEYLAQPLDRAGRVAVAQAGHNGGTGAAGIRWHGELLASASTRSRHGSAFLGRRPRDRTDTRDA